MDNPRISVVIPTHNRAEYLMQALESVFDQSYSDYEVIVVDDGSTDDTHARLQPLINISHLDYVYQEKTGVSAARNLGVQRARAPYIAFLDSDDLFLPRKLERQIALFEADPELAFVHCSFSKFDTEGRDLGVRDTSMYSGQIYPWMLQEWAVLMAMPCMLMRKDLFEELGGFDPQMTWAEDLDLWRRHARGRRVGVVPEPLVRVRVHPQSTTFGKVGALEGFERYLQKAFDDDPALDEDFRNIAYARMYDNVGRNLLGAGSAAQMKLARSHFRSAIEHSRGQWFAYFGWLFSWLPRTVRSALVKGLRQLRDRPGSG